jgi:serine/threonine-protein kinase RsbT
MDSTGEMQGTAMFWMLPGGAAYGRRHGIRIEFIDKGPGIRDIDRAMAGGYSTTNTLGLGLSGSRRLVDHFHIESVPGQGTTVRIMKWKRF